MPAPKTPEETPEIASVDRQTLLHLARMLAGEDPLTGGEAVFADPFKIHMDGYTSESNPRNWRRWVTFMRERGRVQGLRGELSRLVQNSDGTVTAHGGWHGTRKGSELSSGPVVGRYSLQAGRVVEMWTSRKNYAFIFGPAMRRLPGLWWVYLRYLAWSRGRGKG